MKHPIIIPDLLTLLTVSSHYPNGFAIPTLKYGTPFCLRTLLVDDVKMGAFKTQATTRYLSDAARVIILFPDTETCLHNYFDRPGIVCMCGKRVVNHWSAIA